jgi:PEGA domain
MSRDIRLPPLERTVALDARQIHTRAAALAALNWVRSQRATWDTGFVDRASTPPIRLTLPPRAASRIEFTPSHLFAAATAAVRSAAMLVTRVPRAAVLRALPVLVLVAAAAATRPYWPTMRSIPKAAWAIPQAGQRLLTSALASGADLATTAQAVPTADATTDRVGRLDVTSEPPGAQVTVDGQARGATPLTLDNLRAGSHSVVLERDGGSVRRVVIVKAHEISEVSEALFAGWLTVYSPFDVAITEGGRVIRLDDRHQVMLPPGAHELRFENRSLGYTEVRHVDVQPGEFTTLSVVPPKSTLTVTSTVAADVWIDGVRIGQAPLVAIPVDLGTREIVLKTANGDERRRAVMVTAKPAGLDVDFSKPSF